MYVCMYGYNMAAVSRGIFAGRHHIICDVNTNFANTQTQTRCFFGMWHISPPPIMMCSLKQHANNCEAITATTELPLSPSLNCNSVRHLHHNYFH